jgi:hypothetical protein
MTLNNEFRQLTWIFNITEPKFCNGMEKWFEFEPFFNFVNFSVEYCLGVIFFYLAE